MAKEPLFSGFTLVETLIALVLLGVIAMFTIPKILQGNQIKLNNIKAQEAIAIVSGAYARYKLDHGNTAPDNMTTAALVPYINSLGRITSKLNPAPNDGTFIEVDCAAASYYCLRMHNGSALILVNDVPPGSLGFGGQTPLHATNFGFDPDGVYDGSYGDGPSASIGLWLYYSGDIRPYAYAKQNTRNASTVYDVTGPPYTNTHRTPQWYQL